MSSFLNFSTSNSFTNPVGSESLDPSSYSFFLPLDSAEVLAEVLVQQL